MQEKKLNPAYAFNPERDLPCLRDDLYDGNWFLMLEDFNLRLKRRPAVFRLTERIKDDAEYIKSIHLPNLTLKEAYAQALTASNSYNIKTDFKEKKKVTKRDLKNLSSVLKCSDSETGRDIAELIDSYLSRKSA